jgi:hypothetical protein
MVKVHTPGEAPRTITFTRRAVSGFIPVDYCLVPNTRIGYILIPTLLDESIAIRSAALQKMTAVDRSPGSSSTTASTARAWGTRSILLLRNGVQGHMVHAPPR